MEEDNVIYDELTDEDISMLSGLNLEDDVINQLLILLEYVKKENKDNALNIIQTIFNNKKLVDDISEEPISEMALKKKNYTLKLLGDI